MKKQQAEQEAKQLWMEFRRQSWWWDKAPKWLKTVWSYIGIDDLIAVILLLVGILGYLRGPIPYIPGLHEFYNDIKSELVGIGVTVLILGNADQYIRTQMEKRRLILQMGSPNNEVAIEAVRQLRYRDWHTDGTLSGAHLDGADLSGANLFLADLSGADLRGAKLSEAKLFRANLSGADLREADLSGAYLNGADLSGVNLSENDLSWTNLMEIDLSGADLSYANLNGAFLYGTNLSRANLIGADLSGAYLMKSNLSGSKYRERKRKLTFGDKIDPTKWPPGFDPAAAGAIIDNELG